MENMPSYQSNVNRKIFVCKIVHRRAGAQRCVCLHKSVKFKYGELYISKRNVTKNGCLTAKLLPRN